MTTKKMNPDEDYEFYARPENQVPKGPPLRRSGMTEPITDRLPPATLDEIRRHSDVSDSSVSS